MQLSPAQLAAIQDLLDEYHFLANQRTDKLGASFLRNPAAQNRGDGNQVRRIRLQPDVTLDAFFEEVERFFADCPFRAVRTDPFTTPGAIEARLLLGGYRFGTEIVMATDGPLGGRPADIEIRTADNEADWRQLRDLMRSEEAQPGDADEEWALARTRGDAFTWHLALAQGKAVGHFSERGAHGLGYLEQLYVHPDWRRRGIATALVHAAANSARSKGAQLVFLPTDADDTPKQMYAAMGFEPVFVFRNYYKWVVAPS